MIGKTRSNQSTQIFIILKRILIGVVFIAIIGVVFLNRTPTQLGVEDLNGVSMQPTFWDGDKVLISTSEAEKGNLHYEQFVIVHQVAGIDSRMLKRVIGLPGDHLIVKDGQVIRNGEVIDEPYIKEKEWFIETPFKGVLAENEIYVMGDNRNHSKDSRHVGPINLDQQYIGVVIKQVYESPSKK